MTSAPGSLSKASSPLRFSVVVALAVGAGVAVSAAAVAVPIATRAAAAAAGEGGAQPRGDYEIRSSGGFRFDLCGVSGLTLGEFRV